MFDHLSEMVLQDEATAINAMCQDVHEANKKWWVDINTGESLPITGDVIGCKLMLCVSELAEALEGARKNLMDDHLPHRKMIEVELADNLIRVFDLAAALGLDLGGAYVEKMAYNAVRKDHTIEHRLSENGKKY